MKQITLHNIFVNFIKVDSIQGIPNPRSINVAKIMFTRCGFGERKETDHHTISKDKLLLANCYDDLKVGRSYVVATHHYDARETGYGVGGGDKANSRWLWSVAFEVDEKDLCQLFKVYVRSCHDDLQALLKQYGINPNSISLYNMRNREHEIAKMVLEDEKDPTKPTSMLAFRAKLTKDILRIRVNNFKKIKKFIDDLNAEVSREKLINTLISFEDPKWYAHVMNHNIGINCQTPITNVAFPTRAEAEAAGVKWITANAAKHQFDKTDYELMVLTETEWRNEFGYPTEEEIKNNVDNANMFTPLSPEEMDAEDTAIVADIKKARRLHV